MEKETGVITFNEFLFLSTDRWNGYNPNEHKAIIDEYNKVELAKRQLKAEKLQQELVTGQLSEETFKKVKHKKYCSHLNLYLV